MGMTYFFRIDRLRFQTLGLIFMESLHRILAYSGFTVDRDRFHCSYITYSSNCIGGEMVSVLSLSVVDSRIKPWSAQTKDYKIGICYFSATE